MDKKRLRNKADKLLQQYIRSIYKRCYICHKHTNIVGHHFFTKASCNALRYNKKNIIPLCYKCHYLIHHGTPVKITELNNKIISKKGKKWFKDLDYIYRKVSVKTNNQFYLDAIKKYQEEKV